MKQRDYKFRAWDNKEKKWLLGYELPNLGGFSMLGETMLFEEWSEVINRFILQQRDRKPEDLVLMQYIGLKDKNGKEIYEGDIVRAVNDDNFEWENKGVVEYVNKSASFAINVGKPLIDVDEDYYAWFYDKKELEVLGTKFENPELIP